MKKVLAILMLSFLFGFALESCIDDTEEFIQTQENAITPPEIIVPPGG